MIDGWATCSVCASRRNRGADGVPVALGAAAQQADRDRMAERAVRAAEDLAAQAAGTESLAELVGREQSAAGAARRAAPSTTVVRSMAPPRLEQRAREIGHRLVAILRRLRQRAAEDDVDPRREDPAAARSARGNGFVIERVHELRRIRFHERRRARSAARRSRPPGCTDPIARPTSPPRICSGDA